MSPRGAGAADRRGAIGAVALLGLALALALASCGGDRERDDRRVAVIVSAASSLTDALTACRDGVAAIEPKLSFAGSDELAAQIRRGVRPDVYLAADARLPQRLAREGLLEPPIAFATNELVLAVAADSGIDGLDDLAAGGVTLVLGTEAVPFGAYARELLARLPRARRRALLANVRSEEPDVKSAIGKLIQGAADATFAYRTDVTAAGGRLRAIALPAALRPAAVYGGGVVRGARHRSAARAYLASVTGGSCRRALSDAGFGAPPRS